MKYSCFDPSSSSSVLKGNPFFLPSFHPQAVVDKLLSQTTDNSLLISRFQEFLEMEDVRYYVMSSIRENVERVMTKNKGVGTLIRAELISSSFEFF